MNMIVALRFRNEGVTLIPLHIYKTPNNLHFFEFLSETAQTYTAV